MVFSDGSENHFPFQAIADQVSILDDVQRDWQIGSRALRGLISRLEDVKETNVYDMVALGSGGLLYIHAVVCMIIQLVLPMILTVYIWT